MNGEMLSCWLRFRPVLERRHLVKDKSSQAPETSRTYLRCLLFWYTKGRLEQKTHDAQSVMRRRRKRQRRRYSDDDDGRVWTGSTG